MNWVLCTVGDYVHYIPAGDVIDHEVDPELQPCVCFPECHPVYCDHGEQIGWLLRHSPLSRAHQGHMHG